MTCVIGYHTDAGVWIGADSAGSTEYGAQTIRADTKIHQNGEMLMGFCGSYRMGQLLRYMTITPQSAAITDDFEYMVTVFIEDVRRCLKAGGFTWVEKNTESGGNFMVAYRGTLYSIEDDFQVSVSTRTFVCIGSGEEYAYGAMTILKETEADPVKAIKKALKVASEHNAFVAAPFLVVKHKG